MTTSELLEKIIEELKKKLKKKDDFTDYEQVQDYAIKVADTISKAVVDRADSSWINQYGTLDYNLCNELITELLKQDYEYVKEACNVAQLALNEGSNIDLKAILPDYDDDRAHSIVWESANKSLAEFKRDFPVMTDNFSQSIVDDAVRKNADFQWKSGLEPKIVRMAEYKCCEWCSKLDGTYRYEDVKDTGNDVFRRHENCRCKVTYIPSKGNAKDVWSKRVVDYGELKDVINDSINLSGKVKEELLSLRLESKDISKPRNLANEFADYNQLNLTKEQKDSFSELFENTAKNDYEYMIIYSDSKPLEMITSKEPNKVGFDLAKIKGDRLELFHSHTDCSLLSKADLAYLSNPRVESVGNINNCGDVFIVSVGDGEKPAVVDIYDTYSEIRNEVVREMMYSLSQYNEQERTYLLEKEIFYRLTRHYKWEVKGGNINV